MRTRRRVSALFGFIRLRALTGGAADPGCVGARAQDRKRVCAAVGVMRGGFRRVGLSGRGLLLAGRRRPRMDPGAATSHRDDRQADTRVPHAFLLAYMPPANLCF